MVTCSSKKKHQKNIWSKEIGLCKECVNHSKFNSEHNLDTGGGVAYTHLICTRIFTLTKNYESSYKLQNLWGLCIWPRYRFANHPALITYFNILGGVPSLEKVNNLPYPDCILWVPVAILQYMLTPKPYPTLKAGTVNN